MPNNLTDDPTQFSSPIQVPAAGDPRTDTSVATPFQQIANRTANTKTRIDALAPWNAGGYSPALPAGVTVGSVMLQATSIAVMQTIPAANRFDGMYCMVKDFGEYQFDIASALTSLTNIVVTPTDVGGGAGRWIWKGYGLFGAANGIVQADSTSRIPASGIRNGLIYDKAATGGANTTGATLATITLNGLLVGDLIKVMSSTLISVTLGHNAATQMNIVDPSTGVAFISGSSVSMTAPASGWQLGGVPAVALAFFTVVNAGNHSVQLVASTDGVASNFQVANLLVTVTRP